jgi:CheY-like chemotaxis protein
MTSRVSRERTNMPGTVLKLVAKGDGDHSNHAACRERSKPRANATIVVTDSDAENRSSLAELLAGEGYVVVEALSGADALAAVRSKGVDLVITAMSMVGMDGLELLRSLAGLPASPPAIAISANSTEIDKIYLKSATLLGAARTFARPLTPAAFLSGVRDILNPQLGSCR